MTMAYGSMGTRQMDHPTAPTVADMEQFLHELELADGRRFELTPLQLRFFRQCSARDQRLMKEDSKAVARLHRQQKS